VGAGTRRASLEEQMKLRVLSGGLVLVAVTAASIIYAEAADLPMPPAPAPVAPIPYAPKLYDWSGIYVGVHVGGGYSDSSWTDPITGVGNGTFNNFGFLGGAQLGANVQFNRLVLGLEGDFSWTSLKASSADSIGEAISTSVPWTSTVTGRVGAAFDRLLVYGKGGLALAQDQSTLTDLGGNVATDTFMRTGWTAGAGLEYALDDNWSAKIEYDYLGFGSQSMSFTTPLETVGSSASLNVQEIKAGLNYRFSWH
jgi:outer membrane immunogenic protein